MILGKGIDLKIDSSKHKLFSTMYIMAMDIEREWGFDMLAQMSRPEHSILKSFQNYGKQRKNNKKSIAIKKINLQ